MHPTEIKGVRKKLGISQEAFAHVIGVSFNSINRWERGVCKPSRLAIEKIKQLDKGDHNERD